MTYVFLAVPACIVLIMRVIGVLVQAADFMFMRKSGKVVPGKYVMRNLRQDRIRLQ